MVASGDARITPDGVVVIKAQRHRTQERNLADALARLQAMVDAAAIAPKVRTPTRPTKGVAAPARRQQGPPRPRSRRRAASVEPGGERQYATSGASLTSLPSMSTR